MFIVYLSLIIFLLCLLLAFFWPDWFNHLSKSLKIYGTLAAVISGMWWLASSAIATKASGPDANTLINTLNYWAANAAVMSSVLFLSDIVGTRLASWNARR
ncbi:hypothetical protein [Rhizobium sp. YTU87027]|uniref:hypothetical protein n=1 Tax=Rhizobium sp. YTU87027 TaxID=3417741 RepID=UPI003D6938C4